MSEFELMPAAARSDPHYHAILSKHGVLTDAGVLMHVAHQGESRAVTGSV
jgi:hypothetical protein